MEKGSWKKRAEALKKNTYALYLASRDPRVPVLAKIVAGFTVAYALSPIDLIPDFIPVIGYLDDLLLLPIGIWLAIRLVPENVWRESQVLAAQKISDLKPSRHAAIIIVIIWILVLAGLVLGIGRFLAGGSSAGL